MTGLADLARQLRTEMGRRAMTPGLAAEKACVPPSAVRGVLDGRAIPVAHFRRLADWAKRAAAEEGPKRPLEERAATGTSIRERDRKIRALEARVAALEARVGVKTLDTAAPSP